MHFNNLSNHCELFSRFFFDNPDPMWVYERHSLKFLIVNKAAVLHYGYSEAEFLAMTIADIRPSEDIPALQAIIRQEAGNCKKAGVWRHVKKNGDLIYVDITSYLAALTDREAVLVCARDITEKQQLEQENQKLLELEREQRFQLEQSSQLLRIASRSGRFGGWRVDLNTMTTQWSEQTAAIHGFDEPKLFNLEQAISFYASPYRQIVKERFIRCSQYGDSFDEILQLTDVNNKLIWVRSIGEAEYDSLGNIVAVRGSFQDIDELIRTKNELSTVQQSLYETLEQISDAFFLLNREWQFTYINNKAEQLLQSGKKQLLGNSIWDCFPAAVNTTFEQQYKLAIKNNTTVRFTEYFEPFEQFFEVNAYPTPHGLAVYFRDVTEQKLLARQIERSASLQQQAHQLDALGKLTGGIAHDFNNLLTVIISNTEVLADNLAGQAALQKSAGLSLQAALKASQLTQHLLAFGRRQVLKPETEKLSVLLHNALLLLRHVLPANISLAMSPVSDRLWLTIDKTQFEMALLNIVINAREAMPQGGEIVISAEAASTNVLQQYDLPTAKNYIKLAISDTGQGMTEQVKDKAFEPYFTTKAVSDGYGLGLSMVYGFVQQSGGTAYIDNGQSSGCCICLILPATDSPASLAQPDCEPEIKNRLLLVEDDELLQKHLAFVLNRAGYRVSCANSADEAEQLIRHNPYDILLSDIVTPGKLSGIELARWVKEHFPAIKILLNSGYYNIEKENSHKLQSDFTFIAKPYKTADLLSILSRL